MTGFLQKPSYRYLFVFISALITVVGLYAIEQEYIRGVLPEGVLIGGIQATSALAAMICGFILLNKETSPEIRLSLFFLGVGFLSFAFADIFWAYLFYIAHIDRKAPISVILTHLPYGMGYLMHGLAQANLLRSVRKGKGFLWILTLSFLITTPLYLKFIVLPAAKETMDFFLFGHLFNTFFCYVLAIVSFAMILGARELFWSFVATGSIVLVLENWSFRAEMFFFSAPAYGFYDHLWAFGILTCSYPLWVNLYKRYEIKTPEPYDARSLVTQARGWTISIMLLLCVGAALWFTPSYYVIRLITAVCVVALLLSIFTGQLLSEKIEQFATALSIEVTDKMGVKTSLGGSSPSLPLELQYIFKSLFQDKLQKKRSLEEAHTELATLALRVAHDIRQPLSIMNLVMEDELPGVTEETRRTLRASVGQIGTIASDLLRRNRREERSIPSSRPHFTSIQREVLLWGIIDEIISEKHLTYRNRSGLKIEVSFQEDCTKVFVKLDPSKFKRALANLIDNSAEAIEANGLIQLDVSKNSAASVLITISDNGKGIPEAVLAKLGNEEVSHGKLNGNGLGFISGKTAIEEMGGTLDIRNRSEGGARVVIGLHLAPTPKWFVETLEIAPNQNVVILDDDKGIHHVWASRLGKIAGANVKLFHLSTPPDFTQWLLEHQAEVEQTLFLVDYELLGWNTTGLDLIKKSKIANRAILVTNRFDDISIQKECDGISLRLIAKPFAGLIPIEVAS